jgi:hypothetical protein
MKVRQYRYSILYFKKLADEVKSAMRVIILCDASLCSSAGNKVAWLHSGKLLPPTQARSRKAIVERRKMWTWISGSSNWLAFISLHLKGAAITSSTESANSQRDGKLLALGLMWRQDFS